jgi:Ras-related protein Rab-8A
LSGELVAELQALSTSRVEQIKVDLAKVDESRTPAGRLKLLLDDKEISGKLTLQEICEPDQKEITLQLIRISGYSIEKKLSSGGQSKCCEYVLSKIVLTGDSGTGKTNLVTRFARNTFTDEFITTVGVDFLLQTLTIDEKIEMKCQISDNAGVEHYGVGTKRMPYYRGAQGIMVVCDLTNRSSFDNLSLWLELINRHADKDATICIVANKADLEEERVVTRKELKALAAKHGVKWFEVSAKADQNVDEPFYYLTESIIDQQESDEEDFW